MHALPQTHHCSSPASPVQDYANVADNIGVYTTSDYADIVDHLVSRLLSCWACRLSPRLLGSLCTGSNAQGWSGALLGKGWWRQVR